MFLLPWGTGSRNEKVATGKVNRAAVTQPPFPMTHVSLLDKTKRKRRDSGSLTPPCSDHISRKKIKEHVSYVELPPYEGNGLVTSSHGQQGNGYIWIDESPVMSADPRGTMGFEGMPQSKLPEDGTSSHDGRCHQKQAIGYADLKRLLPDAASLETFRESIESQFSLEILLKHRELRLIDQELAKCQIALEQLRRCQIIPYPAMSSDLEDMKAVSSGTGLALETRVPHPPPWGVTDGPYTRHYAKWLIPDSAFDVNATEVVRSSQAAGKAMPERSTRGSVSEKSMFTSASRSQRGSNNARLQALPHGYPEPKEDKGPMILKRSTDGQMVKLVCLDCRRDNFNSAQGFINHCRIAHNRGYTSHDAAALACGEVVEVSHTASVVGESNGTNGASAALVHPLITSEQVTKPTPTNAQPSTSRPKKSISNMPATNAFLSRSPITLDSTLSTPKPDRHARGQTNNDLSSFTPSSQTPHLSALLARRGCGGDLDEMVNDAKQKPAPGADVEMSDDENDEEQDQDMEDVSDPPGDTSSHGALGILRGGRLPARTARSPAPLGRSTSNKGVHGARKPEFLPHIISRPMYSSPYSATGSDPTSAHHSHSESALMDTSPGLNLSPNAIESHPAPSLVSDDGDYENTHSESESPSSADDDEDQDGYLEIEVEDHDDEINALGSSSATTDHIGLAGSVKPHSPAARRSSALRSPTAIRPGPSSERHVSFASPGRRPREEGPKGSRRRPGR